jgi:alpha-tubulin suppressor-like RCC1 family protein
MRRRPLVHPLAWFAALTTMSTPAAADASDASIASYYALHLARVDGAVLAWRGEQPARRLPLVALRLAVNQDACFALRQGDDLMTWSDVPERSRTLMRGVREVAAGQSGWFAIDADHALWYAAAGTDTPLRVAANVLTACVGDSADYFIDRDGVLHAKGLAHRGQYGDGRLTATDRFVATARDAVAVRAHTGHAIHLRRDGTVMGTGGNRYGPLSSHGLGDKADRWGAIFDGAVAIATGSRHSAALRADGSLWVWGEGFAIAPAKLHDGVAAVACGDTATIARTVDGALWQWERGTGPRRVA